MFACVRVCARARLFRPVICACVREGTAARTRASPRASSAAYSRSVTTRCEREDAFTPICPAQRRMFRRRLNISDDAVLLANHIISPCWTRCALRSQPELPSVGRTLYYSLKDMRVLNFWRQKRLRRGRSRANILGADRFHAGASNRPSALAPPPAPTRPHGRRGGGYRC
eukprot:1191165-Pleurochrysis_carterae.AAC.1